MRICTLLTAVTLSFGLGLTASADDEQTGPQTPVRIERDHPLPGLKLIDTDGEPCYMGQTVKVNQAAVIMFFDPEQDPTALGEVQPALPHARSVLAGLYATFKDHDVNWIFVAVGETDAVQVARETWESAYGEEQQAVLAEELAKARGKMFAMWREKLKAQGIEDCTLYAAPIRATPSKDYTPTCAIVRGEKNVSHVAPAGNQQAIDNLKTELHLAVNDPKYSGKQKQSSLPAGAPKAKQ